MSERLRELQAKRGSGELNPDECKELSLLESGDCGGVNDRFKHRATVANGWGGNNRPIKQVGGFANERLAD